MRFLGHVDARALPALYAGVSVFAYPSLYEGFGLPPLEAMACRVPVLASNRSSLPEIVGEAGILIDPDDAEATAARVEWLLEDPGARAEASAPPGRFASRASSGMPAPRPRRPHTVQRPEPRACDIIGYFRHACSPRECCAKAGRSAASSSPASSRDFVSRYLGTQLGFFWAVAQPLAMILIYTLVFAEIMKPALPGHESKFAYSIYLCAGILLWQLFSDLVSRSVGVFVTTADCSRRSTCRSSRCRSSWRCRAFELRRRGRALPGVPGGDRQLSMAGAAGDGAGGHRSWLPSPWDWACCSVRSMSSTATSANRRRCCCSSGSG